MLIHFQDLSGINDSEKFDAAAELLRKNPDSELFLPPGGYRLGDEQTVRFQEDVMAGRMGHSPQLFRHGIPFRSGWTLTGCRGVKIHAEGAEIVVHGFMQVLTLDRCEHVTIEGLRIRHDRLPFSCGVILSDTPEYTDIRFLDARMLCDETPTLRTVTYWNNRYWAATQSAASFHMVAPGIGRFEKLSSLGMKGAEIYVWHTFHYRPAVLLHECENILLRDLCVHNQPGHGVMVHRSGDITLERVRIVPEAGLRVSTNADATHVLSCHGKITYRGCRMIGQGDDSINVHGYYHRILSAQGSNALVRLDTREGCAHSFLPDHPDIGDTVVFSRRDNLRPLGSARVTALEPADGHAWKLELDAPVPAEDAELLLHSREQSSAELEVRDCCMASHLARGILVKARNVLIENNIFSNTTLTAIQFAPEIVYAEGGESENVTIRGNSICDCGWMTQYAKEFSGAGGILFEVCCEKPAEVFHKKIRIEDNIIHCPDAKHAIVLYNTRDARICGNQFCVQSEGIVVDERSCETVVVTQNEEKEGMA